MGEIVGNFIFPGYEAAAHGDGGGYASGHLHKDVGVHIRVVLGDGVGEHGVDIFHFPAGGIEESVNAVGTEIHDDAAAGQPLGQKPLGAAGDIVQIPGLMHHAQLAEAAVLHHFADFPQGAVVVLHMAHGKLFAGALCGLDHGVALFHGQSHGLFYQYMDAGLQEEHGGLAVQKVGQVQNHRVHGGLGGHLLIVRIYSGTVRRSHLPGLFHIQIRNGYQLGFGMLPDSLFVGRADPACANNTDSDHRLRSFFVKK